MCYGLPQDSIPVLLHKYSCLIGTVSTQKVLLHTVVQVGGCMGKVPATKVTHLRLCQSPLYSFAPSLPSPPLSPLSLSRTSSPFSFTSFPLLLASFLPLPPPPSALTPLSLPPYSFIHSPALLPSSPPFLSLPPSDKLSPLEVELKYNSPDTHE